MRKEYDFSKMKGCKNPYAKTLKKQIAIRTGIPEAPYFIIDKSPQKGKIPLQKSRMPEIPGVQG
jgi:hypothetical protein